MESIKRSNKATIAAAALLITVAVSIFGVSADEDTGMTNDVRPPMREDCPIFQELTEEQKTVMEEAHQLMQDKKFDEAKTLLEEAGIEGPMMRGKHRGSHDAPFFNNLTDEQKEVLKEAHEKLRAGDEEGAQAIMDAAGLDIQIPAGPKFGERKGERPEGFKSFRKGLRSAEQTEE